MNKLEMFSEKLGKTITIIAESVEGQKTFKPAMEGTSNSTVSMMDGVVEDGTTIAVVDGKIT